MRVLILTKTHPLWAEFGQLHSEALQDPFFAPSGQIESYGDEGYYDAAFGLADDQGLLGFQCFCFNRSLSIATTNGLYIRPESRREGWGTALQTRGMLLCYERFYMRGFKGMAASDSTGMKVLEKTFKGILPFRYPAYYSLLRDRLEWFWSLRAEKEMLRALSHWRVMSSKIDDPL